MTGYKMWPDAFTTVGRFCGETFVDLMCAFIGGCAFDGLLRGNFTSEGTVG